MRREAVASEPHRNRNLMSMPRETVASFATTEGACKYRYWILERQLLHTDTRLSLLFKFNNNNIHF